MTAIGITDPHGVTIRSVTHPLLPGDELTLWSCQVRGTIRGYAHDAIPGRYVIESCPTPTEVILRRLESGSYFRCGCGSLFAILGEPWSDYRINSGNPLAPKEQA